MFGVGDRVEASRNVKDYGAAWFSAIVLKVLDINTFFVEYEKVKKTDNKGEVLKEILDVQHMRPALPAEPKVMDFIVGVKVEVLVHGGWSPGTVLATFGMGKHVVKLMNCGRNSLYQYDSAKMRHQRVWNGSRWVHNYKKNPQKLQDVGGGDKSPTMKQKDDARFITPASSSASEDMQADNENPPKLQDVDGDESPAMKEKSSCIAPASLLASGEMHLDGCASGMSQSLQHLATADTNASTTGNQADHMEATCPTLVEEPFVSMKSCSFNIKHTEAPKFFDLPDSAEKHISASPCKEGTAVNEESVQTRSTLKAATVNASPLKNVPLPFVKGSLMWESIESMEVFSKMPQKPHFHPLEEYCMDLREGMAIGLMISFVNLVSSVQKLSISDAQIEIETRLKALEQLEENGFNVSCLRMRLNELLKMQLSYKQNETRKAMLQTKMLKMEVETNHDELNASLDKAIGGLEQSIAYFREKKNSMMKQKAIYESEIVKIQLETQEVEEAYRSTEENFKLRVAAPLR